MSWSLLRFPLRRLAPLATLGVLLLAALPAFAAEPTIKLLNAGTGEKKELRVKPTVGSKEAFEMVMSMKMVMDMGGMGQIPQTVPPIVMGMNATVSKVDPNGDIHYDFVLSEVSLRPGSGADPMVEQAISAEMAKMVNTSGTVVVTSRGFTKSSELRPAAGMPADQFAQMQKGMQHASAPFPAEPVGVGAVWEVSQLVEDNGLTLNQTTTYTLKEWKGQEVTLGAALVQKAGTQAVLSPDLPPGSSAALESLNSAGSGTTTMHLGHIFPTKGSLDHKMDTRMKISANGQEMNMGMSMELGITMARK